MGDGDEANDKIMQDLGKKLDGLINDENASLEKLVRGLLEVTKTQQPYLLQALADHNRVMTMWRTYKPAIWAAGIFAATVIGLLASGKLSIIVK